MSGRTCGSFKHHKKTSPLTTRLDSQILRDVGLLSEMTRSTFTTYARRTADSGPRLALATTDAGERRAILDAAEALARYLVASIGSLHSNDFYNSIGNIPWVPATEVGQVLHAPGLGH